MAKNSLDCCLESIGAVRFYQWCFAPLCGHAIDKNSHPWCWVIKQSNPITRSRRSLCCCPCLVWCAVAIIAVQAHMVIGDIGEFFHSPVQCFLCLDFFWLATILRQHRRLWEQIFTKTYTLIIQVFRNLNKKIFDIIIQLQTVHLYHFCNVINNRAGIDLGYYINHHPILFPDAKATVRTYCSIVIRLSGIFSDIFSLFYTV